MYIKAAAGQTGQSADLAGELHLSLAETISQLRAINPALPVAVGIGLQRPEQLSALAKLDVDMAIVGTKIVEHLQVGEQALVDYVHTLRAATFYD